MTGRSISAASADPTSRATLEAAMALANPIAAGGHRLRATGTTLAFMTKISYAGIALAVPHSRVLDIRKRDTHA